MFGTLHNSAGMPVGQGRVERPRLQRWIAG